MKIPSIKVAAIQYEFSPIKNWEGFSKKITNIVSSAAKKGTNLLIFPEYVGMHLSAIRQEADIFQHLKNALNNYCELFEKLARQWNLSILSGTIPVAEKGSYYNRAHLFLPDGRCFWQDKINLVPAEKESGVIIAGEKLKIFEMPWGKTSIAICYDSEFPDLIKQVVKEGVKLILVPSCTSSMAGYYRVAISCRARAIENQCFVVQSCTVGKVLFTEWIDVNIGKAGIFTPCDGNFPSTGILSQGKLNRSDMIVGDLNFSELENVRNSGQVRNFQDYTLN